VRRSVIVSAVLAVGFVLAGCASSPASPAAVDSTGGGDTPPDAVEQPATVGDGSPFSAFPLCDEFNQMSMEDELAVISLATGTEYDEDSGWDFTSNVQSNCSIEGWGDMSVLRAILGGLTDGQKLQVAWSLNSTDGSWGGFSFPAEIDGYRLVGEDEYNEFALMRLELCASMQDLGDPLVAESGIDGHTVRAYYTKFDGPIGPADACAWGAESIVAGFSEKGYGEGWFATAERQSNGVSCSDTGVLVCAVKTDGGVWTAIDRIHAMSVGDLAGVVNTFASTQ